jgi:hypothetical protein
MYSFKKISIGIFPVLILAAVAARGQEKMSVPEKRDSVAPKKGAIKSFKDFFNGKAQTAHGLFSIHQLDEKFYFEIPDSLLGREILVTTRLSKVPTDYPMFPGEIVNTKSVAFFKGPNNTILVKLITHRNYVDSADAIALAVRNASVDPIVLSFDIKATGQDGKGSVIEVSDNFRNDNVIFGFSPDVKKKLHMGGVAADRSYIESMHTYPINIEVRSLKTFAAGAPTAGDAAESGGAETSSGGVASTVGTVTSLMLLPAVPMQQRLADPRIGYFTEENIVFSDRQQKVDTRNFIVRFRMEPKDEDLEKYKRGELVEPKKPIVYYTDPTMPKQWRPYVIAGIDAWQKAFEQAGFKNAIVGREWPEHDSTMSLEDARYFVVRYLPSAEENAGGIQVHDPRSGEILQSYVGWHMSIMRLLHDWYMMQAGAIDPKARCMHFDDQLMGRLIQYSVTHEIGHTLGLTHNMGSSAMVPVEKLREKGFVDAHGITPSIMDYARFDYVAQPEDRFSEEELIPRLGAYDRWAIQWGYRYLGIKDSKEEKKITSQWLTDSLKADQSLWYGGEGKNNDPRSQAEDLGDNNIRAAEYGMKNLKRVAAHIEEWSKEPNDEYQNLEDMYDKLAGQYLHFLSPVVGNIGGVYETVGSPGDATPVYSIVPKERQRAALAFVSKEYFETPEWALNTALLNKFRRPGKEELFQKIQEIALTDVMGTNILHQLDVNERRFGADRAYTIGELLTDVEKGIFSELYTHKQADTYRRFLQKRYVTFIGTILKFQGKLVADPKSGIADYSATDLPATLLAHLGSLQTNIRMALPFATDPMYKAHLQFLQEEITNLLTKN